MPKISLMIHTASADDFLFGQGITSYFTSLTECLERQTFKDFELIYTDTFYEENKSNFAATAAKLPFLVKHVPIHHRHRYWFDRGYCYISAAKNTGILYADGELCVTCDDAEFFPDHLLTYYWNHYTEGCFMHALHKRMRAINNAGGTIAYPIDGDIYINDHRFNYLKSNCEVHSNGGWTYAGTSFALKDALKINGFNERMDGCKSLEDCDFGGRIAMLGCKFLMNGDGYLYILDHPSYGDIPTTIADGQLTQQTAKVSRKKIENLIAVENYGMLRCGIELFDIVANSSPLSKQHLDIIQRETIKYRGFDPLQDDNRDKFQIWSSTPTFNLAAERAELRSSGDWRW